MKGILPAGCRIVGYALLVVSVFAPLLLYMMGQVDDTNLVAVKLGMKLVIWLSLFMVFFARQKVEDEATAALRTDAMGKALVAWGVLYAATLVMGIVEGDMQAGGSAALHYMVLCVLVFEFLVKKRRAEEAFRKRR